MRRVPAAIVTVAIMLGVMAGVGGYTFGYARGWSYLTDEPAACANCHVMHEQHDAWMKGSHRSVALCNDCHVPHGLVGKYLTKARNGFWHSFYFTTGTFPEPIRATAASRAITEAACRHCHAAVVEAMGTPAHAGANEVACIRCHGSVGHLSLAATSVAENER